MGGWGGIASRKPKAVNPLPEGHGLAAARWEKRRLCFWLCKSGIREVLPASARHPPARGSPRPPVPPRSGAPKRAERCQPTAPSGLALLGDAAPVPGALGVGRNCPGDVGEEPSVHPTPPLGFRRDARLQRGPRGGENTAELRPRKRGAGTRGKLPAWGKSLAASRGDAPSRCPPRSQSPSPPRSLAAPPGTPGNTRTHPRRHPPTPLPAELKPGEINRVFLIEPRRGAGVGLEGAEPRRWQGAEPSL